jgi:hypothetical protein
VRKEGEKHSSVFIDEARDQLDKHYQNTVRSICPDGCCANPTIPSTEVAIMHRLRRFREKERKQYRKNPMMALFGSLALTAPMLIMALHPIQLTTLLTTSIFVLVVAMLLTALMDSAESKDVVTATAGVCDEVPMLRRANEQRQYAAVLVVFAGASRITNNDSSLSRGVIAGIVVGCTAGILSLFLTCGLALYLKWALDSLLASLDWGEGEVRRLTRKNTSNGTSARFKMVNR